MVPHEIKLNIAQQMDIRRKAMRTHPNHKGQD